MMELDAPKVAILCPQCGIAADDGRIFCGKCGASFRPAVPLTRALPPDSGSRPESLVRQIVVVSLKGLGYVGAVVAIFCPLGTFARMLVFAVAVIVGLICYATLTHLDETHIEEYGGAGYWPAKPVDRNHLPDNHDSTK